MCASINNINIGGTRKSNLELYRIVVMLLIVAHHFVVNSGILNQMASAPVNVNSIFLYLFGAWGKTGINCYVFITGYFMCKSKTSFKKFSKLIFEVLFYNVIITMTLYFTGFASIKDLLYAFVLVRNVDSSNFTACFLVFYLIIPFENLFLKSISKKQHKCIILILSFLYVFLGTAPKFSVVMNYVSWFEYVYLVAAYIRFYPLRDRKWGLWTLFFITVGAISVIICSTHNMDAYRFVSDCNTFLALAVALCSFMYFKKLPIKQNKLINTIAGSTFGVLCIHANSRAMRKWLWKSLLNVEAAFSFPFENLVVFALGSVLAIYIICTVIDICRVNLIEKKFICVLEKTKIYNRIAMKFEEYE